MRGHEQYEELCALAASGLTSEAELAELTAHLHNCGKCRALHTEFSSVLNARLPFAANDASRFGFRSGDWGAVERFVERAREEGIPLKRMVPPATPRWGLFWSNAMARYALGGVAAMVLVTIVVMLIGRRRSESVAIPASTTQSAASPTGTLPMADSKSLQQELELARLSERDSSVKIGRLKKAARIAADRAGKLESDLKATAEELNKTKGANALLQQELGEQTRLLAEAKAQTERANAAKSEAEANLVAQQVQIAELSEQARLQQATLDMERKLLSAGRDVRDLMGARNLRIVDVQDFDSHGKAQKSFGRIFYTQGKSLIFYAFDLNDRRVSSAKASFQAWGQKLGAAQSTRSLGIFYNDDKTQNRWVLNVDDPNLLREIDTVFVTFEPPGGGKQPSGSPLLHAFLGSEVNHP